MKDVQQQWSDADAWPLLKSPCLANALGGRSWEYHKDPELQIEVIALLSVMED